MPLPHHICGGRIRHTFRLGLPAASGMISRGSGRAVQCVTTLLAAAVISVRSEDVESAHAPQPPPPVSAPPVNGGPAGNRPFLQWSHTRVFSSYAPVPASYPADAAGSTNLAGGDSSHCRTACLHSCDRNDSSCEYGCDLFCESSGAFSFEAHRPIHLPAQTLSWACSSKCEAVCALSMALATPGMGTESNSSCVARCTSLCTRQQLKLPHDAWVSINDPSAPAPQAQTTPCESRCAGLCQDHDDNLCDSQCAKCRRWVCSPCIWIGARP